MNLLKFKFECMSSIKKFIIIINDLKCLNLSSNYQVDHLQLGIILLVGIIKCIKKIYSY
jgi:hypothetical protein